MRSPHLGLASLLTVGLLAVPVAVHGAAIPRHVAISDPMVLRALDPIAQGSGQSLRKDFSLAGMLGASVGSSAADIFALPGMMSLRVALDREFDDYARRQNAGPVSGAKPRLFERATLYSMQTRFALVGIVNRMDRAYKSPDTCGEIRLIYRPVINSHLVENGGGEKAMRLPMTLNLVLNARNTGDALTCGEIAQRWLAIDGATGSHDDFAVKLASKGGVLENATPDHIDRIETNIQIARASGNPDDFEGRADYLMKVFRFDASSRRFLESPMENQIDLARLLDDAALLNDFKNWLLTSENFMALDRGTILVPDKFLANNAIVATAQSAAADELPPLMSEREMVESLARFSANDLRLENILSPAGFARRLDDITCAGCHRTRAIGGFHFTGAATALDDRSAVVTPASPHFIADQERRRDILATMREGRSPDFSRGFSARPQARRSATLEGTTYLNGWGAHCYAPSVAQPKADASFASWTCIDGLTCQMPAAASATRAGLCFPPN